MKKMKYFFSIIFVLLFSCIATTMISCTKDSSISVSLDANNIGGYYYIGKDQVINAKVDIQGTVGDIKAIYDKTIIDVNKIDSDESSISYSIKCLKEFIDEEDITLFFAAQDKKVDIKLKGCASKIELSDAFLGKEGDSYNICVGSAVPISVELSKNFSSPINWEIVNNDGSSTSQAHVLQNPSDPLASEVSVNADIDFSLKITPKYSSQSFLYPFHTFNFNTMYKNIKLFNKDGNEIKLDQDNMCYIDYVQGNTYTVKLDTNCPKNFINWFAEDNRFQITPDGYSCKITLNKSLDWQRKNFSLSYLGIIVKFNDTISTHVGMIIRQYFDVNQ